MLTENKYEMGNSVSDNSRIFKNTILLYIRQIFTLCLALYTSRMTLDVLGATDFGIYAVVGGLTALLSILTSAMSSSTQRFITFELGKRNNIESLKKVYNTSLQIHFLLGVVLFLIAESIGIYVVYNYLMIPVERFDTALVVFQISIFACMLGLLNVPNTASIVAHEDMGTFAFISIIEAIFKLTFVISLFYISWDKLIVYSIYMLVLQILNLAYSFIYCRIKYPEIRIAKIKDYNLARNMFGLAGWEIISNLSKTGFVQGVNILLNIFFGPIMNAAYTVSMQAYSGIRSFCSSFQLASNPQIVKLYSNGEIEKMHNLILGVCKMSFFLIFFLSLPFLINSEYILSLWLTDVPEHSQSFFVLLLIYAYFDVLVYPMDIAAQATGRVMKYNIITSITTLLILPIAYIGYLIGLFAESIYIIAIIMSIIGIPIRINCLKGLINLSWRRFFSEVILKILLVSAIAVILPIIYYEYMNDGLVNVIINFIVSFFTTALTIYFIGLSASERLKIRTLLFKPINKLIHHE